MKFVNAALTMMVLLIPAFGQTTAEELFDNGVAFTETLGLTPFFVGIIIVPIIGNVAEHLVAVHCSTE